MTPQERRISIANRIKAGGFAVSNVGRKADYTALQNYLDGKNAGDNYVYAVEQALDRLEAAKLDIEQNAAG